MPVWRVRTGYPAPSITGWGCLCQVPLVFGVGGLGEDHVCLWQLPKSCLFAFGKPKSLLFSLCFTSRASLPGSFLKNCKATMKFVYFIAHDKKCTVSEFGYRPTRPVIFLLTHCTLVAFILSFTLPSPIHFLPLFFLWKKVFDKGLKTPATLSGEGPQPPDNSSIATAIP